MDNIENKFDEYKKKIIDNYKDLSIIKKLKTNEEFNRNFQFQIHLLLILNESDDDLKEIINDLKNNDVLIHFFDETLSEKEIDLLLELNQIKISKILDNVPELTINDLIKLKEDNNSFQEKRELREKYINAFNESKKKKWFKRIKSKAITIAMFLAFITKTRDKKFKQLLNETIDNMNQNYQFNINKEYPDEEFIKVFYDFVINSSIKQSLIIVLIVLVAIFVAILTSILILTQHS